MAELRKRSGFLQSPSPPKNWFLLATQPWIATIFWNLNKLTLSCIRIIYAFISKNRQKKFVQFFLIFNELATFPSFRHCWIHALLSASTILFNFSYFCKYIVFFVMNTELLLKWSSYWILLVIFWEENVFNLAHKTRCFELSGVEPLHMDQTGQNGQRDRKKRFLLN